MQVAYGGVANPQNRLVESTNERLVRKQVQLVEKPRIGEVERVEVQRCDVATKSSSLEGTKLIQTNLGLVESTMLHDIMKN